MSKRKNLKLWLKCRMIRLICPIFRKEEVTDGFILKQYKKTQIFHKSGTGSDDSTPFFSLACPK